jgi:transposase
VAASVKARLLHHARGFYRIGPLRQVRGLPVARIHKVPLVIVYHILTRREPYRELDVMDFDQRERQHVEHRLGRRLERLGYAVTLQLTVPDPSLLA